jgi:simple sugar transport system ATP-binding protein
MDPVLEMRGITKRFPGVIANDGVNLALYPGEIHALLGENGAGKSTLMNILTGIYTPNEGSIYLKGNRADIRSPKNAVDMGIGMVHQHFKLIEPLTVAENVLLCAGKCPFLLDIKEMRDLILECSERFNLEVDPEAKIWQLSVGEQQRVEILKQLFSGVEYMILDEPTSVLTPQETVQLFKTLRKMADEGKSILFITHKLYEVMSFSDRITVLRDGRSMDTGLTHDIDRHTLTKLMVGRDVADTVLEREELAERATALILKGVSVMGDKGVLALRDIDLEIHAGEILGIAGVAGNGQRELSEVITGLRHPTAGGIRLYKNDITNASPREIYKMGVGFIPEDRMGTGLVGSLDMPDNILLRDFDSEQYNRGGLLKKKEIVRMTNEFVLKYDIKNAGLKKPVSLMSGGNLQKLLIAREINSRPKVLVAAYPVHGVDIGATEVIHTILLEQRARGSAILLISEDLEELFAMSDRVAVLSGGRVTGIVKIGTVTQDTYNEVGRMMLGLERHEGESVPLGEGSGV